MLDLILIAVLAVLCLLAGLIARRATARRLRTKLDQALLSSFPGYAFVKGMAENIHQSEEMASASVPALVTFGESSQIAFETGCLRSGTVALYLAGAPNPWSGNVVS